MIRLFVVFVIMFAVFSKSSVALSSNYGSATGDGIIGDHGKQYNGDRIEGNQGIIILGNDNSPSVNSHNRYDNSRKVYQDAVSFVKDRNYHEADRLCDMILEMGGEARQDALKLKHWLNH